ncbi:fucose isomerase [Collinsella sp. BIOML-A4]|uniref:RbsD/FucU family protein n=1 Tax=unclassified Collinsella TaxID=2637548 RepID=UPI00136C1485|nr:MULTISPECIES: RbsD/FucU domain-containing protein [unclassified Collinsella]MZJ33990.1 fucose isomerase [Collinsella sp. BIOML-A1]MZJ28168.1 fucose isomerase [Collinsella sp. BIOML-A2]MZJ30172.1 fucose isomerase [Collinsella sp. BIOML-A3]MZJ97760.1 fucose isomerase [Collinsella sp. BIOML-A6]MZK31588.1 fucose isomerase [Collinsella sp. BIOML-A5]
MLKGVPKVVSPELLKVLSEMGHGDEIVLADSNYPAASNANLLVRADGVSMPELLDAVLQLIPLDSYVDSPVVLMQPVGDDELPEIWGVYHSVIENRAGSDISIEHIERSAFYERGKKAYAIVATGEGAIYANIIIKKGVVK